MINSETKYMYKLLSILLLQLVLTLSNPLIARQNSYKLAKPVKASDLIYFDSEIFILKYSRKDLTSNILIQHPDPQNYEFVAIEKKVSSELGHAYVYRNLTKEEAIFLQIKQTEALEKASSLVKEKSSKPKFGVIEDPVFPEIQEPEGDVIELNFQR